MSSSLCDAQTPIVPELDVMEAESLRTVVRERWVLCLFFCSVLFLFFCVSNLFLAVLSSAFLLAAQLSAVALTQI
jgi:hypothetical protein